MYTRLKTVTHPGTNRARRALTSFMRRTPLTTTPRRQPSGNTGGGVCDCGRLIGTPNRTAVASDRHSGDDSIHKPYDGCTL